MMHIANKTGWEQTFTVAISTIESKTGFKRSELFEARNILTQKGRINWRQRGGNLCAEYEIIPFCVHNTDANPDANGNTNPDANGNTNPTQRPTISKLKNNKLNSNTSGSKEPAHWKKIIDIWFSFYAENISDEHGEPALPVFNAVQGSHLKKIIAALTKKAKEKNQEWTEDYACRTFKRFLELGWKHDDWMKQNFELANLLSKFNSITNSTPTNGPTKKFNGKIPEKIDYSKSI
jgi:hypothetical protein